MVVEIKLNQYITVTLISAKRFKNEIFGLFAVSSYKRMYSLKYNNFLKLE